jgi:hypothetical protein
MTTYLRISALALGWLALAAACSGDDTTPDTSHDADDGGPDDGDAAPETEADAETLEDVPEEVLDDGAEVVPPCAEPGVACLGPACHVAPYAVTCVSGTVSDETGAPLADQAVALCAADRCFFTRTDATGWFARGVPVASIDELALYFPSSPPPLPPRHSPFCLFGALCDGTVHLCNDFRLYPAPTTGTAVPSSGALTADIRVEAADGAALILPAGAEVLLPIDVTEFFVTFSRFPLAEHQPCFIDPANPPLALYVVTPIDSEIIQPDTSADPVLVNAGLDLPNDTGLAAGTVVDVFVVGGAHALDAGLAEGEWRRMTSATVSADGTRIRTAAGDGIGYLTWFGIYAP